MEEIKQVFKREYLDKYELALESFEYTFPGEEINDYSFVVISYPPLGIEMEYEDDAGLYLGYVHHISISENTQTPDRLFELIKNHILDKQKVAQMEEEIATLRAKNAKLQRKITKLELSPGGASYLEAQREFNTLAEKQ